MKAGKFLQVKHKIKKNPEQKQWEPSRGKSGPSALIFDTLSRIDP
jgi:hypothetical protein